MWLRNGIVSNDSQDIFDVDLRGLNVGQPQNVLAEIVFNLPVHIFPYAREIYRHILRCWIIASNFKNCFFCFVVTNSEREEVDAE